MGEETGGQTGIMLEQKNIDLLVANIIPTTKYFESRFDHLQYQFDEFKLFQKDMKSDIDGRFVSLKSDIDGRFVSLKSDIDGRFVSLKSDIDGRFLDMKDDINKRFEQVEKHFEQVDKRFEQIDEKLDKILDRIDRRIDEGLRENRATTIRMFTFAMTFSAISMVGLIGKFLNLY